MGTRGFIGFVIDGTEKIAYNHWDSYPKGLGVDMLTWLRGVVNVEMGVEVARDTVRALRVVTDATPPTPEDVERLAPWTDLGVGEQSTEHWYNLLRKTQGNPAAMLRAGAIEDASKFPVDSLFAEWGYVVDLDAQTFEVYEGFQEKPHDRGRFASRPALERAASGATYYPVALVASWPLDALPDTETFLKTLSPDDEDD